MSAAGTDREALAALLTFYRDAGVDVAVSEAPVDRFAQSAAEAARAAERVAPRSPHLDDEYATAPLNPRTAAVDATLTMALPDGITGDTA